MNTPPGIRTRQAIHENVPLTVAGVAIATTLETMIEGSLSIGGQQWTPLPLTGILHNGQRSDDIGLTLAYGLVGYGVTRAVSSLTSWYCTGKKPSAIDKIIGLGSALATYAMIAPQSIVEKLSQTYPSLNSDMRGISDGSGTELLFPVYGTILLTGVASIIVKYAGRHNSSKANVI